MPTPATLVGDLLKDYPQLVSFFIDQQLSCVGCSMAIFDTLADVAQNYHLDLNAFLQIINRIIEIK